MNLETLLAQWAAKVDAETILERIVGRATSPACVALAAQGKTVVTVVDPGASTERVKMAYGLKADVRVAGNDDVILPKSDLVVVHGDAIPGGWRETLASLGKLAAKAVVLVADNPDAWPTRARVLAARLTGSNGVNGHAAWGKTGDLAPTLWEIGRVREHVFLDVPPLGERRPNLAPRIAPRHAFVVDVTPRTPQARRRLRLGA